MTSAIADRGRWIRRYHPAPDGAVTLVCFPHAGGSASFFHPVSARLSPQVEVCAVQYPGRQDRRAERPFDDIHTLADAVAEVLRPRAAGGKPLAFFGHSMGATVAFEVAMRLEAAGAPPLARLFLSGRRAPACHREESVHLKDDPGLVAELQSLGGTEALLLDDPEIQEMVLPAVRADYRAIETYRARPGSSVSCPVVVLVGDVDPKVTPDEAKQWEQNTTGGWDMRVFPGGHFYLVDRSADVIALVAETLRG